MKACMLGLLLSLVAVVSGNAWAANACGPSSNLFYVLPNENQVTTDGVKTALAIALTAFTLGKTVNILYDDTITDCPIQIIWMNP